RAEPLMAPLDQPGVGPHLAPGGPLLLDGRQAPPSPAPELGEHTDEVLGELLSMSPAQVAGLRAEGVVG
ncbi:2-methylfumaryl-CoA isomerase, partial [Nonomuraea sp. NPDC001684]